MDLAEKISNSIRQQVTAAGKKVIVVGLSGGIDSASLGRSAENGSESTCAKLGYSRGNY